MSPPDPARAGGAARSDLALLRRMMELQSQGRGWYNV